MSVEKQHEPVSHAKPVPAHPLATETGALRDEIAKLADKHKEDIAKLRQKVADLVGKIQSENLSKSNEAVLGAMQTEVEAALNIMDPESAAR